MIVLKDKSLGAYHSNMVQIYSHTFTAKNKPIVSQQLLHRLREGGADMDAFDSFAVYKVIDDYPPAKLSVHYAVTAQPHVVFLGFYDNALFVF